MPRAALSAAIILAALAVAPVAASASAAAPAAESGSALTVTATATGTATFTLPATARVTVTGFDSAQVSIAGRGRVLGVLLNRLGEGQQPSLLAYRTNLCASPGCSEQTPGDALEYVSGSNTTTSAADGSQSIALPAGRYAVTAFVDGAPATITLQLDGLDRPVQLEPNGPASVRYDTLPPDLLTPAIAPAGPAYSAGRTYATQRPAWMALVRTNETVAAGAAQSSGFCYYSDAPPAVYATGCGSVDGSDTIASGGIETVQDPNGLRLGAYGAFGPLRVDDQFSIGQYVNSAVPIRNVNALQVLVQYAPDTVQPTAAAPEASATANDEQAAQQRQRTSAPAPQAVREQLPVTGSNGAAAVGALSLLLGALVARRHRQS